MKNIFCKITILLLLISASLVVNAAQPERYHKWMDLSSEKLLEIGDKFIRIDNNIDSALVCFSIVNNRYNEDMSDAEKIACCKAGYGKWYIYFGKLFDYTKAYESLLNTREILNKSGLDYPYLDLGFAVFYHTLAGHSYDKALDKEAYNYCLTGFWSAYKQKDYRLLDIFFCNLMLVSETLDNIQELNDEWEAYKKIGLNDVFNYRFNVLQYNARILKSQNKYEEAKKYANELVDISQKSGLDIRRTFIARFLKALVFYEQGQYSSAISILNETEKMLSASDLRDCRLEIYEFLSKCYNKLDDTGNSNKFGNRYYLLKDSIINLKQMTNVSKMPFINEMKKMDSEINEMKYKRNAQIVFVVLSSVFSLILLVFVVLLYKKNKQLKSKNRKLYEKNIEMMNSEDLEIKSITNNRSDTESAEKIIDDDITSDENEEEKYKNSSLSNEDKKILLAKILGVMENIDEICSVSFSAERLAQLTNSKYKYVSQVINEKYGCNFNMFLNKFRIKEACRRFSDDKNYGQYTIDAMSQSLGFKSRTTFTSSFKKIIGLTPSQYSKLAKEDKEHEEE